MSDYFALLDEPRRPWLDSDRLKEKFLTASATVHPDRVHTLGEAERAAAQERYTLLNAAYSCLRDPRERLRHLLELERGKLSRDVQPIPSDLMDLSLEVGQACRQADTLIAEKARVSSPLLQVQLFERAQEQTEKLQALRRKVSLLHDRLVEELKTLDDRWSAATAPPDREACFERMEELHRLFGYFARWMGQAQERVVQLSL